MRRVLLEGSAEMGRRCSWGLVGLRYVGGLVAFFGVVGRRGHLVRERRQGEVRAQSLRFSVLAAMESRRLSIVSFELVGEALRVVVVTA